MLALLLQLLAPLPVSRSEATPICTGAGIILLVADGLPPSGHANGEHCLLCLLPRADASPGSSDLIPTRTALAETVGMPAAPAATPLPAPFPPYAQRAPPAA